MLSLLQGLPSKKGPKDETTRGCRRESLLRVPQKWNQGSLIRVLSKLCKGSVIGFKLKGIWTLRVRFFRVQGLGFEIFGLRLKVR